MVQDRRIHTQGPPFMVSVVSAAAIGALVSVGMGCGDGGSRVASGPRNGCGANVAATTLFTSTGETVSQPVLAPNEVIFATTDAILGIALAGGMPTTLAREKAPSAPVLLNGVLYFGGLKIVPNVDPAAPPQSVPTLYSVPVAGGDSTAMTGMGELTPVAADDTSLYLKGNAAAIRRWTPSSGSSIDLPLDFGISIDDIAVSGNYVYVAAQDLAVTGLSNGVIARIPKDGGPMSRLVTNIGHPFHIAVDGDGLYWAEDPPALFGAGSGRLARSGLDGSATSTLVNQAPLSLVISNRRVVFSTGTEIDSVPTNGGQITLLASGFQDAGMITGANGILVWVDPSNPAFGSTTPPIVMTACAP